MVMKRSHRFWYFVTDNQAPNLVVLAKTWNNLRQVDFDIVWWADSYESKVLVSYILLGQNLLTTPHKRKNSTPKNSCVDIYFSANKHFQIFIEKRQRLFCQET